MRMTIHLDSNEASDIEISGIFEFKLSSSEFNAISPQDNAYQETAVHKEFNESLLECNCHHSAEYDGTGSECWCICHGWVSRTGRQRNLHYLSQRKVVETLIAQTSGA